MHFRDDIDLKYLYADIFFYSVALNSSFYFSSPIVFMFSFFPLFLQSQIRPW